MTSSCKWIILSSSCTKRLQVQRRQLLKINDSEFGIYDPHSKCIHKYNTINNKCTKWINLTDFNIGIASFALNQDILYAYTKTKLMVMNTKQNTHNIYDCNNCAAHPATVIINNKLHVVAGFGNNHLIWNEQQSQFNVQHKFELHELYFHCLIYLKSKHILLCIGGITVGTAIDTIYSFDIILNKWSKLKQKLPIADYLFGCISTRNDQYIILFGVGQKKIYILNCKTMKFRQSGICCPIKGIVQSINMNSIQSEQLLCFGYIKQLWNTNEFNNLINLPFYLINIIRQYVAIEMVHLIHTNGSHWKMNVDDIITTLV